MTLGAHTHETILISHQADQVSSGVRAEPRPSACCREAWHPAPPEPSRPRGRDLVPVSARHGRGPGPLLPGLLRDALWGPWVPGQEKAQEGETSGSPGPTEARRPLAAAEPFQRFDSRRPSEPLIGF